MQSVSQPVSYPVSHTQWCLSTVVFTKAMFLEPKRKFMLEINHQSQTWLNYKNMPSPAAVEFVKRKTLVYKIVCICLQFLTIVSTRAPLSAVLKGPRTCLYMFKYSRSFLFTNHSLILGMSKSQSWFVIKHWPSCLWPIDHVSFFSALISLHGTTAILPGISRHNIIMITGRFFFTFCCSIHYVKQYILSKLKTVYLQFVCRSAELSFNNNVHVYVMS